MPGEKLRKGPWFEEEDERLTAIISIMGERRWDSIAKASGLRRSGKSCRLRWLNYLCPNLKHGRLSAEEERIVLQLHQQWGNKWSKIARRLPGRTDNEIKNYWRSHLRKKAQAQEQEQDDDKIMNNLKQENYEENDGSVRTKDSVDETDGSVNDDIFRAKDDFIDVNQFSGYEIVTSPYENQLSDWLFEQRELSNHWATLDTGFSYPAWNSENSVCSFWQSSSFL